jgi:hypothetical protein
MALSATVQGLRVSETDTNETLRSTVSRTIRTQTSIGLLSQIVYSTGPFKNRGPVPPKVDTKTTYTIIWTATNTSNDVRGAEVRATLPQYVKWLDVTSPTSETVTWNPDKNELIWRVGDIAAGTGSTKPSRQAAFQVEITPSISQVGFDPTMLMNSKMTAIDSFTGAPISDTGRDLTTKLTNDPKYSDSDADVIQ